MEKANEPTPTESKIMDAALHLFSNQGYRETTTRKIAERADCNELTIFRIFENKENLLRSILKRRLVDDLLDVEIPFEPTGRPREDLISLCRIMQSSFGQRRDLFRLMLREQLKNDVVKEYRGVIPVIWKDLIVEKFSSVINEYSRDDINLETASLFMASYVLRAEMMKTLLGNDPFESTNEEHLREAVDIFLRGTIGEGSN